MENRPLNKYCCCVSDAVEKESSDADSDAEPEAVKFVDSRKNVLDRVRTAIRQIERDRQQLKTKRQKKDAVCKEQKVWHSSITLLSKPSAKHRRTCQTIASLSLTPDHAVSGHLIH